MVDYEFIAGEADHVIALGHSPLRKSFRLGLHHVFVFF